VKLVTSINNLEELSRLKLENISEVILKTAKLSRFGKLNKANFRSIAEICKNKKIKVVLDWDALVVEQDFSSFIDYFNSIPVDLYDAIRVQDPGVTHYVLEHSNKKIQLVLETGNHNLIGIEKWISALAGRCERVVLSIELPKIKLSEYIAKLSVPVEILGLGRILLFYTPRSLLSPINEDKKVSSNTNFLEAVGASEESPHKGFPLLENQHGTFMFLPKDFCLLDHLSDLKEIKLQYLRLDLDFVENKIEVLENVCAIMNAEGNIDLLKTAYNRDWIRGFYHQNKSDVLFKKLKNQNVQRKDSKYVGEVIDFVRGEYTIIDVKKESNIKVSDTLKFIAPEGDEIIVPIHFIKKMNFEEVSNIGKPGLYLINYSRSVWVKTQVYLNE
jgi:putative protease